VSTCGIKALKEQGRQGTFLNVIKAVYSIPIANITVKDQLKVFPLTYIKELMKQKVGSLKS
jgi:hypothetical protein